LINFENGSAAAWIASKRMIRAFCLLVTLSILTACGGGGGGSTTPPQPPPPGGTGWQMGMFMPASTFAAQCQAPRTGSGDMQGMTVDENNFLRSYSDDTYLWYSEIVDQDPGLFNDSIAYFNVLRTTGLSSSKQAKDQFHFTFDTEEWIQLSQSGVSAGYGTSFAVLAAAPPREIVVAYTDPNTPATNLAIPLTRGAAIISVDGAAVVNGDPTVLNAGLFQASAGETHTFEVLDLGAQTSRMITMTAENIASTPVQNVSVIDTPTGRIGYMLFNDHIATAEDGLVSAVNQLNMGQGIDDLVLDLRYNGGGFLAIASQMAYMIAGPTQIAGRTFETTQFNDKHTNTDIFGQPITPTPFYNVTLGPPFPLPPGQALPTLNLPRVYVLTSSGTCSASEAIMNGLRGIGVEVIQIGSTTCGKPYGFFPQDNCGTTYFTIQFRGVNYMNFGDYSDGFVPSAVDDGQANVLGCSVQEDFTKLLGDPTENRLEVALAHQAGMGCIAPSSVAPGVLSKTTRPLDATDGIVPKSIWHTNRIMRQ
jgi:carboxyl-terminal processing protease